MKKFFILLLMSSMLLSQVACSDKTVSQDVEVNSNNEVNSNGEVSSNNEVDSNSEVDSKSEIEAEEKDNNSNISEVNNDNDAKEEFEITVSTFNLAEANNDANNSKFEIVEPMYNLPEDKQFNIKLNLGNEPFDDFLIEECFGVYTDRECENKLLADVKYDKKTNTITIKPDKESWAMYPREGIESDNNRTWGSLQTYYLLINHDVLATKVTQLEKPKRMMFTIASKIDIPTVTAKPNKEGNITLHWDSIPEATEYKVYYGGQFKMKELSKTKANEFVLTEEEYRETSMNTLLSDVYDYAVVAVKGNDESRLSNVIKGVDYMEIAPNKLVEIGMSFTDDDIDSILELPRNVDVEMHKYLDNDWLVKSFPVIWDFDTVVENEFGTEYYKGKVLGTTFNIKYIPYHEHPTAEEIAEFNEVDNGVSNAVTTDVDEVIDIPNAPSNSENAEIPDSDSQSDITQIVTEPENEVQKTMEIAIAEGMLNHNNEIDLSAYKESGDSIYLRDVLGKVCTQYPLILDEKNVKFDFVNKRLLVEYEFTKEEMVKKQKAIQDKVAFVVNSVIKPDMSIEQKEQVLHDWLVDNSQYHEEILQAYLDGTDVSLIAAKYADSFNPYGILINGVGVCQSYAESYKLLCDAAGVPCVVASGTLGSVPHAWNKVKLDNTWYHVDATNNDNDGAIPYAVFNASDRLVSTDFAISKTYVIDSELDLYLSDKDDKDYYKMNGNFAESELQLKELLEKNLKNGQDFCIKIIPDIPDDTIIKLLGESYQEYGTKPSEKVLLGKMFNILGVKYTD